MIDLTYTITDMLPVYPLDDPISLKQIRSLKTDHYNDWELKTGMHVGTHIDGPGHLTNSSVLLSDIPLNNFIGKGFLIDARNKPIDESLLQSMPTEENLIVLILTGFDKQFGSDTYFNNHPILTKECAEKLVAHKVKMVGIDFFSPDHYPFDIHKIFFKHDILIIENLRNLEQLIDAKKFTVIALPLKTATDSAPARVIALLE